MGGKVWRGRANFARNSGLRPAIASLDFQSRWEGPIYVADVGGEVAVWEGAFPVGQEGQVAVGEVEDGAVGEGDHGLGAGDAGDGCVGAGEGNVLAGAELGCLHGDCVGRFKGDFNGLCWGRGIKCRSGLLSRD